MPQGGRGQYIPLSPHFMDTSIPSHASNSFSVSCKGFLYDIANQEVLSDALLCFGASSVTVDDIADAGNLDEVSEYFLVRVQLQFP